MAEYRPSMRVAVAVRLGALLGGRLAAPVTLKRVRRGGRHARDDNPYRVRMSRGRVSRFGRRFGPDTGQSLRDFRHNPTATVGVVPGQLPHAPLADASVGQPHSPGRSRLQRSAGGCAPVCHRTSPGSEGWPRDGPPSPDSEPAPEMARTRHPPGCSFSIPARSRAARR